MTFSSQLLTNTNNGMWQSLLDTLLRFKLSKDIRKKFLEVISVDIWPFSSSSQFDVIHRVSVIHSFMNQITKLGARHTSLISESVGEYLLVHPEEASRWTLYYISSGGCLYNISMKGRRSPISILKDRESRSIMKKWLLQATKVMPPMKASDFGGFVKDHLKYTN